MCCTGGGARGRGATSGSRPCTASGLGRRNVSHADGAMAALSRQLVQAKMGEADAQRKHRCLLPCCSNKLVDHCGDGVTVVMPPHYIHTTSDLFDSTLSFA